MAERRSDEEILRAAKRASAQRRAWQRSFSDLKRKYPEEWKRLYEGHFAKCLHEEGLPADTTDQRVRV
jgi:hypothetical protein